MPWVLWIFALVFFIGIDVASRYVRLKLHPRAWTRASIITSAAVWSGAWLIIAALGPGLNATSIIQSVLFGLAYFGVVTVLAQRISASTAARKRGSTAARKIES
jgi:hypothetical protein